MPSYSTTQGELKSWQIRALAIIAECIIARKTITYASLAEKAQIPAPHRISKLSSWLEELIEEDVAGNAPIRAAVVVSKINELPAQGFFDKLQEVGISDAEDRNALHQNLCAALFATTDSDEKI